MHSWRDGRVGKLPVNLCIRGLPAHRQMHELYAIMTVISSLSHRQIRQERRAIPRRYWKKMARLKYVYIVQQTGVPKPAHHSPLLSELGPKKKKTPKKTPKRQRTKQQHRQQRACVPSAHLSIPPARLISSGCQKASASACLPIPSARHPHVSCAPQHQSSSARHARSPRRRDRYGSPGCLGWSGMPPRERCPDPCARWAFGRCRRYCRHLGVKIGGYVNNLIHNSAATRDIVGRKRPRPAHR